MSEEIEWAEPPEKSAPAESSAQILVAALKARPGQWAIYRRCKSSGAAACSGNYLRRAYGLETKCRTSETGHAVYARWPVNGNGSEK